VRAVTQVTLDLAVPGDGTGLLAQGLADTTFCVVDLETTGGSPEGGDRITEVGAVKVRGGEVLGEFETLVDPGIEIPPAVSALTGLTSSRLRGAPTIGSVLPAFLEFARGCVLVAHNAGFDISFLRAACTASGREWPAPPVLDTVRLARAVIDRDEAPDHRLATLARVLGATTQPSHRALADARATVDVLHRLIERLPHARTVSDLAAVAPAAPARARKRHLAARVPDGPGVYQFVDARGRVLYVGSATDLRSRVHQYFTRGERRRRMTEMIALAVRVVPIPCPTLLEARVREVRLIADLAPPYNRRSRHPDRLTWLVLTDDAAPRPALVREPGARAPLAAFPGRGSASSALEVLSAVSGLRTCTDRLPRRGGRTPCVTGQIGRCPAPCATGTDSAEGYRATAAEVREALLGDPGPIVSAIRERMGVLGGDARFEEAAGMRDGLDALVRGVDRAQRLAALSRAGVVRAARRLPSGPAAGGWELVCIASGRLAGTAVSPPGRHPGPTLDALAATSDLSQDHRLLPDEADLVWRWLAGPGVRLVSCEGPWSMPLGAAGSYLQVSRA
jgi:DNA polymerase-3 subunit epsilon